VIDDCLEDLVDEIMA